MISLTRLTRRLPVELTEDERRAKGDELARAVGERADVDVARKEAAASFKEQLEIVDDRISLLSEELRSGSEQRDVEVREEFDRSRYSVNIIRCDTDRIVEVRPATEEDRQRGLPGVAKQKAGA